MEILHKDVMIATFGFIHNLIKPQVTWDMSDPVATLKANIAMPEKVSTLYAKSIIEAKPNDVSLEELSDLVCVVIFTRGLRSLMQEYAEL